MSPERCPNCQFSITFKDGRVRLQVPDLVGFSPCVESHEKLARRRKNVGIDEKDR